MSNRGVTRVVLLQERRQIMVVVVSIICLYVIGGSNGRRDGEKKCTDQTYTESHHRKLTIRDA